ncbi:uncharacterized protein DNG_05820 [Cephalotrichum gorgonifer]|uniref:SnoaL-like domain-containing protein n=1 Tax=Cephalotrichum gorgonifer TaxID=2041049 RepID=A0AAE8N0I8_9PEZI|nr:uncharacterized protein DNG_05820 [Cephalotrichum gorgonifer]
MIHKVNLDVRQEPGPDLIEPNKGAIVPTEPGQIGINPPGAEPTPVNIEKHTKYLTEQNGSIKWIGVDPSHIAVTTTTATLPGGETAVATITKGVSALKNDNGGLDIILSPAVKTRLEEIAKQVTPCGKKRRRNLHNHKRQGDVAACGLRDFVERVGADEELQSTFAEPLTDQAWGEIDSGYGSDDPFEDPGWEGDGDPIGEEAEGDGYFSDDESGFFEGSSEAGEGESTLETIVFASEEEAAAIGAALSGSDAAAAAAVWGGSTVTAGSFLAWLWGTLKDGKSLSHAQQIPGESIHKITKTKTKTAEVSQVATTTTTESCPAPTGEAPVCGQGCKPTSVENKEAKPTGIVEWVCSEGDSKGCLCNPEYEEVVTTFDVNIQRIFDEALEAIGDGSSGPTKPTIECSDEATDVPSEFFLDKTSKEFCQYAMENLDDRYGPIAYDIEGNAIPIKNKALAGRSPPEKTDYYLKYNIFLGYEGKDGDCLVPKEDLCRNAYEALVRSNCGTNHGSANNRMFSKASIDIGCGRFTWEVHKQFGTDNRPDISLGKRTCHESHGQDAIHDTPQAYWAAYGCEYFVKSKTMKPGDASNYWHPIGELADLNSNYKISWIDGCTKVSSQDINYAVDGSGKSFNCTEIMAANHQESATRKPSPAETAYAATMFRSVFLLTLATAVRATSLTSLARDVERLESVREIKDVQKSFAQYAQFGRWHEMAGLFSDDGTLHWGRGAPLDEAAADIIQGPADIEALLEKDAGDMDGIRPGSFNAHLNEMPVVSLSEDGATAKVRWQVLRLMGDGAGATRVQGGVYENEYRRGDGSERHGGRWRISLLHYYPMTEGDFSGGWGNVGSGTRTLPIIPFHFTPDEAGIRIPLPETDANSDSQDDVGEEDEVDIDMLAYRLRRLNDEDEVRNLQHAYGYYVDQRMWADILDLCTDDVTMAIDGNTHSGPDGIRSALEEWMGAENLTEGILNEHPMFDTIVQVSADGSEATARGLEMGLIGDMSGKQASWRFNVFFNTFAKDEGSGIWKLKTLGITRLIDAPYRDGWGGKGSQLPKNSTAESPEFLSTSWRSQAAPDGYQLATSPSDSTDTQLDELKNQFSQSAAYDETENIGSAYGYFADDIRCQHFAGLHAEKGFKESPGVGWYHTRERIAQACLARYNTVDPNPQRPRVPFHWRLQPVVLPSKDGRSTTMRTKLLQFGTSSDSRAGFNGVWGFNGGMYHDQFVLEDKGDGIVRRKLWCLTIDEFYWQSPNWEEGWIAPRAKRRGLERRQGINGYLPDVDLKDPALGDREVGFSGGPVDTVSYPQILPMWFEYRNPVSGRLPEYYWGPGCVPCRGAKPEWALRENGYQEPPTGPTLVTAVTGDSNVMVKVTAGPEEVVSGVVELRAEGSCDDGGRSSQLLGSETLDEDGSAVFELSDEGDEHESERLVVLYLGNENIRPGRAVVVLG